MEKTNLLTLVVTLTLGIILAGSLLMPVISDATETERTFTNDGLIRMDKVDTDYSASIFWDHTDPTVITVNDETYELPQNLPIALTVGGTEEFFIRYNTDAVYIFQNNSTMAASVTNGTDLTVTIANGEITSTDGTYTITFTYSDSLFIVSDKGKYVMKNTSEAAYVKGDSDIHAYGRTYLTGTINTACNFAIDGTITDGFTIEGWGTTSTITATEYTVTSEVVAGYVDLHKFTKIDFTASDGTNTATATYGQVIVPYEVTAELTNHLNSGEIAIMNALPIMIIVALVVMAAGALYLKRDD